MGKNWDGEIKSVPKKGLGLVAITDIPAGTRILVDQGLAFNKAQLKGTQF